MATMGNVHHSPGTASLGEWRGRDHTCPIPIKVIGEGGVDVVEARADM